MEEFSLAKVADFHLSDFPERVIEVKNYVKQYFIPLNNGNHAVYVNGQFEVMEQAVLMKTYFKRMHESVSKWYFTQYLELRSITYELNKPLMYENKLNLCPAFKHNYKPYKSFSDDIKEKVDIMLNYIYEILADSNQDQYDYLLKWISNMLKGNKNDSCLYVRGGQGIGKSTLFVFLRDFVIGKALCLETGSAPIKSNFNNILGGKLLVILEELETFSTNEWMAISSRLKRYITSNTITLEKKGVDAYDATNTNNYAILSNNDSVRDDDGRRYFILDIAIHRVNDKPFWNKIYGNCFTDEVGAAFFSKLLEIDTTAFSSQYSMPLTKAKKDALVKRLEHQEEFIKNNYVMKSKDIECGVQDLYNEYKLFCSEKSFKCLGKIDFGKKLKDIGITYYKTGGVNKYKVPYAKLKEIATKKHWIHELDDTIEINDNILDEEDEVDGLKLKCQEQDKRIQEYEKRIKELEKQLKEKEEAENEPELCPDDLNFILSKAKSK
jgi:hypothetical protein